MQLFYTTTVENGNIYLTEEEARHVTVLRKKIGDTLQVLDGKGNLFNAELSKVGKHECQLAILSVQQMSANKIELSIGIAPTKNIDRFEWFLEKATEIGVDHIYPLRCKHSERDSIRLDRLSKILVSAMKQSKHYFLPNLYEMMSLEEYLKQTQPKETAQLFIAHCADTPKATLAKNYEQGKNVTILIGPEGDFSTSEIQDAINANYKPISLGNYRLRTETAGIVACHTIQLLNDL